MKCLHPLTVPYYPRSSTKYKYDAHPELARYKIVPCGKCVECQSRLRNNWSFRLMQEMEVAPANFFVTLTYDNDKVPVSSKGYLTLRREDLHKFLKKFRDDCQRQFESFFPELEYKERHKKRCPMKYFAIGDYGETTFRPHYHFIVFNSPYNLSELYDYIAKNWQLGQIVQVDICLAEHCNYITKYIVKVAYNEEQLSEYECEPTFRLMSRGLGMSFVTDVSVKDYFVNDKKGFHKGAAVYGLPAYLKQKFYKKRYGKLAQLKMRQDYTDYIRSDKYDGFPKYFSDQQYKSGINENVKNHDSLIIKRQQKY